MNKIAFSAVVGTKVLLDTNIIMKIEDSPKDVREAIVAFAKALECLSEGHQAVRSMFERLNWLYVSCLRKEPWAFLHRQQNDLWIIAAGLAHGFRNFLTTDGSADFLPQLFDTQEFSLDAKQKIHLHEFNNEKAGAEWGRLYDDESCEIHLPMGYLGKLKEESWVKLPQ